MWNTSAPASVRCTIFMMIRTSRPTSQPRRILIVSRAWPHGLTRFEPAPARLAARRKTRRLCRGAQVVADSDRRRPKFENSRVSFNNSLLSRPLSNAVARRVVTRRSATYSKTSIAVLAKVWEAAGYLCSQRLKAALPQWLPWIKKHFKVNGKLEKELLAISARQMDRRLSPHKRTVKRRLYGTTRPGSLLKHMIPIKTDHWDVTLPGTWRSIWSRIQVPQQPENLSIPWTVSTSPPAGWNDRQ
jgi:hypothetical protein